MFHLNVFRQFAQDLKQNMTLISNNKFNKKIFLKNEKYELKYAEKKSTKNIAVWVFYCKQPISD